MKQGKIPLLPVFAEKCKCIQKFRITWAFDRMVTKDLHHKFFIFFPTLINDYTYPAFHIIKTGFVFFPYRDIYISFCVANGFSFVWNPLMISAASNR